MFPHEKREYLVGEPADQGANPEQNGKSAFPPVGPADKRFDVGLHRAEIFLNGGDFRLDRRQAVALFWTHSEIPDSGGTSPQITEAGRTRPLPDCDGNGPMSV